MPIKLDLRENGRVIYADITDPFLAQDFVNSAKEQKPYYDSATEVLHQLVDVTKIKTLPMNVLSLSKPVPAMTHPKHGQLVIIGANAFIQAVGQMIMRVMHYEVIKFASTEAEAWTYIRNVIAEESQRVHHLH